MSGGTRKCGLWRQLTHTRRDRCLGYMLLFSIVFWGTYSSFDYASGQHNERVSSNGFHEQLKPLIETVGVRNNAVIQNALPAQVIPIANKSMDRFQHRELHSMDNSMDNYIIDLNKTALTDSSVYDLNKFSVKVNRIYFVKVHKAGSTSIQNILHRFGFSNDLPIALFKCPNGMPFPQRASKKYMVSDRFHSTYSIMCDHALYDEHAFYEYMPKDTIKLGILRHPLDQLRSSIAFHNLVKPMRLKSKDITAEFLSNPQMFDSRVSFTGSSRTCGPMIRSSFTQNHQAYHFGYTQQKNNNAAFIEEFINSMDEKMDLMLILERYDESLILMRRMFHWTIRDILSLPLFTSQSFGKTVGMDNLKNKNDAAKERLINQHKHWSAADYALYEHFLEKLDTTIAKQSDDFFQEVQLYRLIKDRVRGHCKSMCTMETFSKIQVLRYPDDARTFLQGRTVTIAASDWNPGFSISYIDCLAMGLGTLEYQAALRIKQAVKNCVINPAANQPLCSDDRSHYVFYTFEWTRLRTSIFKTQKSCSSHFN